MDCTDCKNCTFKSEAAKKLREIDLMRLAANSTQVRFTKGETIIREGALSSNIIYLREGLVKIHLKGPVREQIVKITKAPTFLGVPTAIGDRINHYSVTAIEPCDVCFIDEKTFATLLSNNGAFAYEIALLMSRNELVNYHNCVNRTQKMLRGRLAEAILFLGKEIYASKKYTMPLSRAELADWLDATRESVSRVLSEFHEQKIIKLTTKSVEILDEQKLEFISKNG